MKIRNFVFATALGLGPAAWIVPQVMAQPLYDTVKVNLPYSVTLGKQTLTPGDYTIQQLRSDDSTVLLFYNKNGMKFRTSALTIKALGAPDATPEKTTITLHRVGDNYYFDKLWVQGKDYGYDFPLPASVRAREKEMSSVSVPAESSSTSTLADTSNATTVSSADENTPATPPVVETKPAQPATPTADPNMTQPATTPVPVEPQPQVSVDTTPQTTPTPDVSDTGSANREKRPASDDTNSMPATSAGWLMMLLSGGTLSGAGMLLRRKR